MSYAQQTIFLHMRGVMEEVRLGRMTSDRVCVGRQSGWLMCHKNTDLSPSR